jgi:uncharacterized SAM-binding protein YcdF (DUF218 family)
MGRFLKLIFKLLAVALLIFLLTVVWVVLDGQIDLGAKADVALVTGHGESSLGASEPRLDRAIQLYNDGEFPFIVVSMSMDLPAQDGSAAMAKYLESHGIPSNAIIEDHREKNTQDTARDMAEIMKSHRFHSVMVVTDYYKMTRMKLALHHDGVTEIEKAHVGNLQKQDAWEINREVVALYDYIGKFYLLPAAEKLKKEAQVGIDKFKANAEKAKEKVDKKFDSLSK